MKLALQTNLIHRKMNTEQLAELSCVLFFSNALFRLIVEKLLGSNFVATLLAALIPYIPLVLICILRPKKYIKLDFIVLFTCIIAFFALTLLIHPEYKFFYLRDSYGIWDHVFKPYRGIYAYLFIRIVGEPKRLLKCMKKAGWLLMVYFVYKVVIGEWTGVTASGILENASYSVSFGYEVLVFALLFLYSALTEKKLTDIIAASADILMILVAGSRGPILFIGLFLVLYLFLNLNHSKKRILIITIVGLGAVILYLFYIPIFVFISNFLNSLGVSSRFVTKILNGTITDDSNRTVIWNAAFQMIRDNPFGYGAMGSRHVIYNFIYAGYPHSIVLEFLIDYGVFFGGLFLLIMCISVINVLFSSKYEAWRGIFLVFFSAACSMLISLTYWSRPEFWSCLALCVCAHTSSKKKYGNDSLNEIFV